MAEVDSDWYALRNTLFAEGYAEAESLVAARPELLHLMNGIGETVLHFLAVEDAQAGVAWLHARGADINTKNEFGTPVLFEVASLGYKDLFQWLVAAGADVHAQDAEGQDLVEHLLECDKEEIANWVRAQVPGL
jgi:ankyrin repeat protein